jgi:hypothetical protein
VSATVPYNGPTRAADGLTVFASRNDGASLVLVRAGMPLRDALREICDVLDAKPGRWYIDVISSPSSIWRDLQGSREEPGKAHTGTQLPLPESQLLGQIGRLDLLRGRED